MENGKKVLLIHSRCLPIYNKDNRGAIEKLERIYLEYNETKNNKFIVYSPKIAKDNFDKKRMKNVSFRNVDFVSLRSKIFRLFFALKKRFSRTNNNEFYIREVIKDIKKRSEENEYDLIIFENEEGSIPLFRKKTETKTRIALHLHNDYVNIDTKNSKTILDNCDEVWCVSKFIESRIKEVKNIKTIVISNTVEKFPSVNAKKVTELRKKYRSEKNIIFLFVGRLLAVKGISELVDAFNIYNSKNRDAKLIIIGDFEGGLRNKNFAKHMRAKFNSNRNIDAVGYKETSEIVNYYRIANAQVIPSRWNEAFGLVVLEAMQGGVRIICSSHGAFGEICNDKAIYVSKNNMVSDLVKAMEQIATLDGIKQDYYSNILSKYTTDNFLHSFTCAIEENDCAK